MKLTFSFLLIISTIAGFTGRKDRIAYFNYQITPNELILEFKIQNELYDKMKPGKDCKLSGAVDAWCLKEYLNANSMFSINDSIYTFELIRSDKTEQFFTVQLRAVGEFSTDDSIMYRSNCFYEFIRKIENRVIIQRDGNIETHRLNRKNRLIRVQ